ncbi:hypothetical protein RC55_07265 [Herbaspirillum seropedicae]|nr:hypothetical protein ACP92_11915 [Herbaspirillum seropedicae]NQE29024.1 hypothetical protein [Herbaspirillum seropedicae]
MHACQWIFSHLSERTRRTGSRLWLKMMEQHGDAEMTYVKKSVLHKAEQAGQRRPRQDRSAGWNICPLGRSLFAGFAQFPLTWIRGKGPQDI